MRQHVKCAIWTSCWLEEKQSKTLVVVVDGPLDAIICGSLDLLSAMF